MTIRKFSIVPLPSLSVYLITLDNFSKSRVDSDNHIYCDTALQRCVCKVIRNGMGKWYGQLFDKD